MQKVAGSIPVSSTSQPLAKQGVVSFLGFDAGARNVDVMVRAESARVIDGRRALLSGLFATLLVGVAAYFVLGILPIAVFVAALIGFPTGFAASFGRSLIRVVAWSAVIWAVLSAAIQPELLIDADFGGRTQNYFLAQAALFLTVISIAGLCAGCSHIVCRVIPPRLGRRQPFQVSLAEALIVFVLFAGCVAFAPGSLNSMLYSLHVIEHMLPTGRSNECRHNARH